MTNSILGNVKIKGFNSFFILLTYFTLFKIQSFESHDNYDFFRAFTALANILYDFIVKVIV